MSTLSDIKDALAYAANSPDVEKFQRLFTDEMLEGLVSRDYVEVAERDGFRRVFITLKGTRCLMDYEGLHYD